jgi:AAA15 family ATPase/GTPase
VIIKIEIENFYSIKDKQVLDLRIPLTTPKSDRFCELSEGSDVRVPKVIAFFGANASGKTTFLRAISFIQDFIGRSFHAYEPLDPISVNPFKRSECQVGVTKLAIEFTSTRYVDLFGKIYRYELHIQHHKEGNFVLWEALWASDDARSFSSIFERRGSTEESVITASQAFELPEGDPRRKVRSNVSLLSSLEQFAHGPSRTFIGLVRNNFVSNIKAEKVSLSETTVTHYLKANPDFLQEFNRLIRVIDVGIESVRIREEEKRAETVFVHSGLDGVQSLKFESQGTKNFFFLFPHLVYSLKTGATAIVDEIDSDLHPALMWEIVRWYHSLRENKVGAQLVVSCQNPSILSELEKEEVCLVEKNGRGESSARRLSDFGYIRRDTNLYKKYLGGAFGAVPSFG